MMMARTETRVLKSNWIRRCDFLEASLSAGSTSILRPPEKKHQDKVFGTDGRCAVQSKISTGGIRQAARKQTLTGLAQF